MQIGFIGNDLVATIGQLELRNLASFASVDYLS